MPYSTSSLDRPSEVCARALVPVNSTDTRLLTEKHRKELAQTLPDIVGVLEDSSESTATAPIIELIGGVLSKSTITEFYAAKGERAFDRLYQLAESDQQLLSVVTLLSLLLQSDWPLFNHIALPRFLQLARQTLCEQSAEKGQKRLLVSMALAQMAQSKRLNDVRQTPGYAPFETAITDWCRRTFVAAQSVPEVSLGVRSNSHHG